MNLSHSVKIALFVIFSFQSPFSKASQEMDQPPVPTVACIVGQHVRISVQAPLESLGDALKKMTVRLPNGLEFPLDFTKEFKGRIPVCNQYFFDSDTEMRLDLIGHDEYEGCSEVVLFRRNGKDSTYPNMVRKEGTLLAAIRIQVEARCAAKLPTGKTIPAFLRARAMCRYEKVDTTTQPVYNHVMVSAFTVLASLGTYANDPILLAQVMKSCDFTRHEKTDRLFKYVNDPSITKEDDSDSKADLGDNAVFVIGDYIRLANEKYGTPSPKSYPLLISFFVQNHLIDRTEVPLAEEMLGF